MPSQRQELLKWYALQGIDFILSDTPQNSYLAPPALTIPSSKASAPAQQTHPAFACNTLDDLQAAMENYTLCPLKPFAQHTVFADGNKNAKIMLIGEAPGADEDRLGKPFVGQSGQLLDRALAAIGLDRTSVYISNIIPWRPPGNRPPTTTEVAQCQPFIERHIQLIAPKIVIFVGGVSAKTLLQTAEGITRLRGKWLSYKRENFEALAFAIYHPAYLLRSPGQKAVLWQDLLMLREKINELNL